MAKKVYMYIFIILLLAACVGGWVCYFNASRDLAENSKSLREQRTNITGLENNIRELNRIAAERKKNIIRLNDSLGKLKRNVTDRDNIIIELNKHIDEYERNQQQLDAIIEQVNIENNLNMDGSNSD